MSDAAQLATRLRLVTITDPTARLGPVEATRRAVGAGTPCIQLRWKNGPTRDVLALGQELRSITRDAGSLLIVNDRVDVALAVGADGAHLGDDDLPLADARRIVPGGFILGRSVDNAVEAARAEAEGADYVGIGPVFATTSKGGLGAAIGPAGVAAARRRVALPIVGIGGITVGNSASVLRAGADGVAVIGAVMWEEDPAAAARALLDLDPA